MLNFSKKEKIIMIVLLLGIVITSGSKYILNQSNKAVIYNNGTENNIVEVMQNETKDLSEEKLIENIEIVVDICGEVINPGVIKLKEGDRVVDAVNAAGGLLENADRKKINMARLLQDGEQIIIPQIGESLEAEEVMMNVSSTSGAKININRASQAELEALNGIGEVLSQRIIQYRESSGPFRNIEDIMKVSGIGTKKFDSIKDQISIK